MTDTLQSVLIWVGIPLVIILAVLVENGAEWAFERAEAAATHFRHRLAARQADSAHKIRDEQDSRAFVEWLAARTESGSRHDGFDESIVQAQHQSDSIRMLIERELPQAARRCLETHRLNANVVGAYHFSEIAFEPECFQLRKGMVWLLKHTVRYIESYPLLLEDPRLLHNCVVLRRGALTTCRNCPVTEWQVSDAPRLCPTAELVQVRDPKGGSHV